MSLHIKVRISRVGAGIRGEAAMSESGFGPMARAAAWRELPAVPGAWPLAGHAPALLHEPLSFLIRAYRVGPAAALRLGPRPAILVNGAEPVRRILMRDAAAYDKGFQFDQLRILIGDGIGTSVGVKHRRQRRLMHPAFDHAHVAAYTASVAAHAAGQMAGWRAGRTIEAAHAMRVVTMAAVAHAMFGGARAPAGRAGTDPTAQILAALPGMLDGIGRRALLPMPWFERLPTPGNRRFEGARRSLHTLADGVIADHRATVGGAGEPDLLDLMLAARDEDGAGMTDEQVHDEIMTILLAGTETAAGTLSWTVHELSRRPRLQSAVRREIADTVGDGPLDPAALARLALTRRVVSEVLRLYPPGWILGRRPMRAVEIAGVRVPAGTQVLLNFYALHRDPLAFPDPDRFDPDRWLDPGPESARDHYFPFGGGLRGCIGEGFGWVSVLTALVALLGRFAVRPVPGEQVRPVARTTLQPARVPLILEAV
jgi:cytochrome P450